MGIEFTAQESSVLYGLLADHTTDIIVKTDRAGFIRHASPGIARLGMQPGDMLIMPHLLDLVHTDCASVVADAHEAALLGKAGPGAGNEWIEFTTSAPQGAAMRYAMRMHGLSTELDEPYGVLCVMRCTDELRALQDQLFAAEMTDSLTGLTNRKAFVSMLSHLLGEGANGCLALFDIDHFRTFNLRYGSAEGDRVLIAFAEFLRGMTSSAEIVSRTGGESFGILFPASSLARARAKCSRIVETLAELGTATAPDQFSITASAGLAPIAESVDATLRSAELALFFAKARGRGELELAPGSRQD